MPIQLDKILGDIAEEKVLHPFYPNPLKKETDDAWARVGKKNKLSVHEARSIFKVLQKKYEQEKIKDSSSWKLFSIMEEIHKQISEHKETGESLGSAEEEEEFVEMLEVHDEDDAESDNSSTLKNRVTHSPDKDQKVDTSGIKLSNQKQHTSNVSSVATPKSVSSDFPCAMALQKKGIVMKKTTSAIGTPTGPKTNFSQSLHNALSAAVKGSTTATPTTKTAGTNSSDINSPVSIKASFPNDNKRKLSLDATTNSLTIKKQALSAPPITNISSYPIVEVKQEPDEQKPDPIHPKINVITIPGNPMSADLANGPGIGITSTSSTNGYSSCIEDIDFRNDIIFDSGPSATGLNQSAKATATSDIINIGNFENHLPPTFFKNLCNSNRHEALGLYVANVMNRVTPRIASRLELNILRAIIEAKAEEMEQ